MTNITIYNDTEKRINEICETLDLTVYDLIDTLIDDYYETTYKEEVKKLLERRSK